MLKKLPIGIQTFSSIINENYLYIDKTKIALHLIENNKYVFLSRPRRFGKSLFLDTLQDIFQGSKELFKGLDIYDKYDFEKYPVIKIDWAGDFKTIESTKQVAYDVFKRNQEKLNINCELPDNAGSCFSELIYESYKKYKKPVVVLIDEYDKPILDNIDDIKKAHENRDFLRSIYIQLKANDRYLKFVFLTGVTKFSKASIFSGLNNITDISLNKTYGNICGYTQENIENEFKEYLQGIDLDRVKLWYNGYNFLGDRVYNPFDILQFINNDYLFKNYWWESGNSFGLMELIKKGSNFTPTLQNLKIDEMSLNSFDIEKIQIQSLLFQAGYLTIDKIIIKRNRISYQLKVPNMEVKISLNNLIADYLTGRVDIDTQDNIYDTLEVGNLDDFKNTLISLFAKIANSNYRKNNIAHFEGYYASVVYSYLTGSGLEVIAEDITNDGFIDLTIKIQENIYILEFKMGNSDALLQIKNKNYHQKYLNENKNIYLVGINFDENSKNISNFEVEKYKKS
jgi:hypothetical protein